MGVMPCGLPPVKKLYRAANLPDAHLLRGLLGQAGIEAHVFNENAQSGVGQLPFTEAWPEVWVSEDRDLPRAREIVLAFERTPRCVGQLALPRLHGGEPRHLPAVLELWRSLG